jgi:hypothetical protein
LQRLTQVFEPNTKEKAGRSRRILIINNHNSHLNLAFIDFCDRHRIIPIFLPPHFTHRLQPLDVSLFSLLANYYTQEIDKLMTDGRGLISMSKRFFWKFFRAAWDKAFSKANITEGFAATGVWPFDPQRVIKKNQKNSNSSIGSSFNLQNTPFNESYTEFIQKAEERGSR